MEGGGECRKKMDGNSPIFSLFMKEEIGDRIYKACKAC